MAAWHACAASLKSPEVVANTMGYTARDFANYASGRGVKGAPDVKQYLDTNWSYIPVSA